MILSHQHRFIFIHVAKTGGTSVESALCRRIGMHFNQTRWNDEVWPGRDCKHITAAELKEVVGPEVWAEYFSFAFVRHPYDRLLSVWSMHKQEEAELPWVNKQWAAYDDFASFLRALRDGPVTVPRNIQSYALTDANGDLLVDFVGRFENLQQDLDQACDRIGLPHTKLPHLAKSRHRPYLDYFDDATRNVVRPLFERDFELFGYEP